MNQNDNISNDISSQYYEVCSNSIELNQNEKIKEKENNNSKNEISEFYSEKSSLMKQDSINNYDTPIKKTQNNINLESISTNIFSSNKGPNLNNIVKSIQESVNKGIEKTLPKRTSKSRINIFEMNSVKKRILSPIEENANKFNRDNCSINSFNSEENLKSDLNIINEVNENNINKNININIIINKKKKQINNNKFVYNNSNINNINKINTINENSKDMNNKNEISNINNIIDNSNNDRYKNEISISNANINMQNEKSIYSSLDEISNTTIIRKKHKKLKKQNKNKENNININSNNESSSFFDSNFERNSNFENSISDSLLNNKDNYNNTLLKEDTIIFKDYMSFMINTINFEDIEQDKLTVNDLKVKYNLREIQVRRKDVLEKDRFIKTLIELQIFNFDNAPIWIIRISKHGKYLAAGNKLGKIRIYEIMGYDYDKYQVEYNKKNIINFLHFVEEKAIKEFNEHKKDITDLCWSPFKKDLLLSASLDHFVILWDISKEDNCLIEKYEHNDFVTCVQFSPIDQNIFITGCFDKYIRIYNISNEIKKKNNVNMKEENKTEKKNLKESKTFSSKKIKDFFNLADKITSISIFPEGRQLAIGTINGKINIYDILNQQIRYNHSFTCRNRVGKNCLGKKITSINFINKKNAVVTTCDSCVRLISMNDGKNISKYKGYENEQSMIRASVDLNSDVIISGSENGFCYIWHIIKDEKKRKNYNYEYFQPFSRDIIECSIIIDEKCFVNYIKKVLKLTNKINIISVIINSTNNGKIEVLLNINEENS